MPRERIPIVEDDAVIGSELIKALAASGYEASLAEDGQAALTDGHDHPPDLILLDLGLPDIEGVELCRRLRADLPHTVIARNTCAHYDPPRARLPVRTRHGPGQMSGQAGH